jgi:hypothetical protein
MYPALLLQGAYYKVRLITFFDSHIAVGRVNVDTMISAVKVCAADRKFPRRAPGIIPLSIGLDIDIKIAVECVILVAVIGYTQFYG